MNKVILTGRLVADPEIRQGSTTIARYRLAVDRRFNRDDQKADFINVVAFGKGAEFAEKFLYKGKKIGVSGRLQSGSYKKSDGSTVYTTEVIADEQEFLESRSAEDAPTKKEPEKNIQEEMASNDGFMSVPDDMPELPFM